MSHVLLKTSRFTVERRSYDHPRAGRIVREVVVHPGAVTILALLEGDRVVLIRNFRFAVGRELLELPAGTLEPPEPPVECAARELQEETGYVAGRLEPLGEFYTTPGFTDEHMHVFLATDLKPGSQALDTTEQIRVEILPLADALAATADGRIVDAKTIAAFHLLEHRKGQPR